MNWRILLQKLHGQLFLPFTNEACGQLRQRINCEALSVFEIVTVQPIGRPRRKQTNVLIRTEIPNRRMSTSLGSARFRQRILHLFWRFRNENWQKHVYERRLVSPPIRPPVSVCNISSIAERILNTFYIWELRAYQHLSTISVLIKIRKKSDVN